MEANRIALLEVLAATAFKYSTVGMLSAVLIKMAWFLEGKEGWNDFVIEEKEVEV